MIHPIVFLTSLALLATGPHDGLHEQIAEITRLLEEQPREAGLYLRRAELHRLHRDWQPSLADLERVESLDPAVAEADLVRGRLWHDRGELGKAEGALDRFLERRPEEVEGLLTRGAVRFARGTFEKAFADYDRAVRLQDRPAPEHYVARAEAMAARGAGFLAAAVAGLEEGLRKLGPIVTLLLPAIDLEVELGRFDSALARVASLESQTVRRERWVALRGEVLLRAGRREEAGRAWREALALIERLPVKHRTTQIVVDLEARLRASLAQLEEAER